MTVKLVAIGHYQIDGEDFYTSYMTTDCTCPCIHCCTGNCWMCHDADHDDD